MPEYAHKQEVDIRLPDSGSGDRSVRNIHVSDVLNYIGKETGVLDREEKFTVRSTRFRLALGLAWEDYLAKTYEEILFHPGEFSRDGIFGSPDGVSDHGFTIPETDIYDEPAIDEFKLTWLSSKWKLNERTNRIRMWQVLAYCKLLELNNVNLWVGYLNGDYNRVAHPVFAPDPVIYRIRFSQEEVDKNWDMMVRNVPDMLEGWKGRGWWEGRTDVWDQEKDGAGRMTDRKLEEADIWDLDLLEDAMAG